MHGCGADPGTRPGPYGQTLVSTGLTDFDRLLGGGAPLGALLLVLEDAPPAPLSALLLRYFLAEGVAVGHACHWAAPAAVPDDDLWLPQPAQARQGAEASQPLPEPQQDHLRIAWQYRRYMNGTVHAANAPHPQQQQADKPAGGIAAVAATAMPATAGGGGASPDWCHAFDLSRPQPAAQVAGRMVRCSCIAASSFAGPSCQSSRGLVQWCSR